VIRYRSARRRRALRRQDPLELTPEEIRVIRTALGLAVTHHTARGAWPAAEAAQQLLDRVSAVVIR
jgi:hypothetical protein